MSKFDYKKIMPRYVGFAVVMAIIALIVIMRTLYIMTAQHEYWTEVASKLYTDSLPVAPTRGNILSCDGQLMASTLPEYKIYMDFKALKESKTDTLWPVKVDSICMMLHEIFPERSAQAFKDSLEKGRAKLARHYPIWKRRINYNTFLQVKDLPIFKLKPYKSGFHFERNNARQKPYGSLASRTIGDMYAGQEGARFGLELSFDTLLHGKNGYIHRRKVLNSPNLGIMLTPAEDGKDIVTTIDVGMQDLAERAVIDELKLINGNVGVAIVMEVATGDIKAIVNMEKCGDGEYRERKNHAVNDLREPGSVFKTASLLVALDDGVVDTTYRVETGSGVWPMYGREMKDHNWRKGGYGNLTLPQTLHFSSNIGVSRIIDEFYHKTPEKFVEGIYRTGIADDLHIPIKGATPARIRKPKKDKRGKDYANWSKTALAWMSIGYETQIPPISTLTFYNAIANNGKMMRPRLVKQVLQDGVVVQEFPPVVQREQIAKPQTIKIMQTILEQVVSRGLGKKAGSKTFKVAGKTGTAQIADEHGGYHSGITRYLLSFAGYFPADAPRYSCIVCIQKDGLPASGGGMSGVVFHHIAEGIMAQSLKLDVKDARDSTSILIPDVKDGNITAADYVLKHLGIKARTDWNGSYTDGNPIWGKATISNKLISLNQQKQPARDEIPDVIGMGARDAVFRIESLGVRVRLQGRGKVTKQSLEPGHKIKKGEVCMLLLE